MLAAPAAPQNGVCTRLRTATPPWFESPPLERHARNMHRLRAPPPASAHGEQLLDPLATSRYCRLLIGKILAAGALEIGNQTRLTRYGDPRLQAWPTRARCMHATRRIITLLSMCCCYCRAAVMIGSACGGGAAQSQQQQPHDVYEYTGIYHAYLRWYIEACTLHKE